MHVGFQTISFGRSFMDRGRSMLQAIKEMGYEAVELAQNPSEFGSAKELYDLLSETGLRLLGLSGGSLTQRVQFLRQLLAAEDDAITASLRRSMKRARSGRRIRDYETPQRVVRSDHVNGGPPYIYLDSWDESVILRSMGEVNFALHTHMFTPFQTTRAIKEKLSQYRRLLFLPDTAHLTVAGERITHALYDNWDRITAVHLKDWTSEFGRSYHFYARGFGVRFGDGDVNLREVVAFLNNPESPKDFEEGQISIYDRYDKWLVVEQDTVDDPRAAAEDSLAWLRSVMQ